MKKNRLILVLISLALAMALCFALAACGGETACTEHTDADSNGKCDTCGADVEVNVPPCTEHTDANSDGKCDTCGTAVEPAADGTLVLVKDSVPTFQIIIGDVSSTNRSSILALAAKVNERIGDTKVSVADENSGEAQPVEILIGSISNRGEQYAIDKYSLGYDGYIVEIIGTKLVVLGGSDFALTKAITELEKEVFGIKGSRVKPIENLTVTESIDERVTDFTVDSVTIAGNDMMNYVIAANAADTYAYNAAVAVQEIIYRGTGKHLELAELSTLGADALAIVLETVENGGDRTTPEGYHAYVTEGGRLTIVTEFPDKLLECSSDTIQNKLAFASKKNVTINVGELDTKSIRNISYEDFGAKGDGRTDDSEAIRAAHEYANKWGHNVVAGAGRNYYIGVMSSSIMVKTNTDWNGSTITIDDSLIEWDDSAHRNVWVFDIRSDDAKNGERVAVPEGFALTKGQTNIGMTFDEPCMLQIANSNKKIYIKIGENASSGTDLAELILVDENGNVDPSTPIQYDYEQVTYIRRFSIDDRAIKVGNGTLIRITPNPKEQDPNYENNVNRFNRGVYIQRSNVTLYNIIQMIENEDMTREIDRNGDGKVEIYEGDRSFGVSYNGMFSFKFCYNSGILDSTVEGHQAYSFWMDVGGVRTRNEVGSYAIVANDCMNWWLESVRQYENAATDELITNRVMYHGVMGTNNCRNIVINNCYLDRFDSHQGLYNAKLTNSTFGFGILVIGAGELYIENVERLSGRQFIELRNDYNGIFDGDIIIKNCVSGESIKYIIGGTWKQHYNGLPNQMTRSVSIDGLIVKSNEMSVYGIGAATTAALTDSVNPLYLPEFVKAFNVFKADGKTKMLIKVSVNVDAFSRVPIQYNPES